MLPDTNNNSSIIIVVMEEEEEEDNEEVKKAFGDFAERLDDDTRLEALRGLERKMMISDDFVDDGDTKNVGCIVENVERHLERRLKEDFEDDDDVNDDEFNHHSKKGEKRSKSARIYATVVAMARRRPRLERAAEEAYERTVVHPTRMFSSSCQSRPNVSSGRRLYLERILFALDACGKIGAEEKSRRHLVSSSSNNNNNNVETTTKEKGVVSSTTNEVVKFCIEKLYIEEGDKDDNTKDANREVYVAAVACLSSLAKHESNDGTFTIEDVQSLLRYVEKGTSVGDSQGTLACGGSLRVLAYLMPKLLENKRRKYGLGAVAEGDAGKDKDAATGANNETTTTTTTNNNNNNNNNNNEGTIANFLGQRRRTGVEEMELKMYSKTTEEDGMNSGKLDVFDHVDFNAVTALVGKKTLQSGHHVPAWIKSAGCEYLAHNARKKDDFVLLAKACTDKRHWSVRLAALKAFAKLGFHSRPYYTQLILFNAQDRICEIREQLCETLKKSWQGKQCEPKPDGSDDLKLFQTAECVGELMRDPDAGVRAKAIECIGYVRGAANTRRTEMARMLHDDTDETVREMAADSLARLGFLNVNTGEITADGNYRTAKFISNKRLFLRLIAAEQAAIIQELGGAVGHAVGVVGGSSGGVGGSGGGGGGGGGAAAARGGGGANDDEKHGGNVNASSSMGVNKILTDKSKIIKLEKMKNIKVKEGDTIRVFWPDDQEWYEAKVVQAQDHKKSGKKTTKICYVEDGVEEEIDIRNEKVELRYKPHKKGCKTQWVPCGNQESERAREERRKQFAMQKALREAERLAEIEIRREQREMEKKEKEKQKEREKEEEEKMKMLAAANVAGNVKLTNQLKPSATAPKTGAGTTGKSRNGFWKTITFSSNIATNDSNDVSEKKEKEATNNADEERDAAKQPSITPEEEYAKKFKEYAQSGNTEEKKVEEKKVTLLNDDDIKLLRGLVKQKIKVYWPLDKIWYVADVLHFDEQTNKLKILYVEDQLEEEIELWTERSQQYIPPTDLSHRGLHGIKPLRVPVEIGGVEGFLEVGARRNEEYIVFKPPSSLVKKRKSLDTNEDGNNDASSKRTKWHAMKGSDFERKFNKSLDKNTQRRWRKNVLYNPRGWQDCKESNLTSKNLRRVYGNEKMPLVKWLIKQGDQWGGVVIGKTLEVDLNCIRGSQFVFKNGYAIVEEGDEEEAKSDWLLCKITDYNVQSGEHLVCPIDENGIIAGDAVWMVLASQRTKPNEETKKSSDEDVTMETCTNSGALDAEKADEEKRG